MDEELMNLYMQYAAAAASGDGSGDGSQSMEDMMMRMMMSLGSGLGSSNPYGLGNDNGNCAEDNWRNHPMGALFRAAKENPYYLEILLKQDKYIEGIDSLDGDGGGVLHNASLNSDLNIVKADVIVQAFKKAGADLNLRGGGLLRGETPLHLAALYWNVGMVKALINAGASCNVTDDAGRTPLDRVTSSEAGGFDRKDYKKVVTVKLIEEALEREKSDPDYVDAASHFEHKLRKEAGALMLAEENERAIQKFEQLINLNRDDDNHRDYGCLAHCALEAALDKIFSGQPGYRQLFKTAYTAASKSVELNPSSEELVWVLLARSYMGYSEMPRAKQACANGLKHFPDSEYLREIWSVLDEAEVPDVVVDHESEEFKDIQHRLYIEHWIGSTQCFYCQLKCMDEPLPDKCPFCGCPVKKLDDDTLRKFTSILVAEDKDEGSDNGEAMSGGEEEDSDSDDSNMPSLVDPRQEL